MPDKRDFVSAGRAHKCGRIMGALAAYRVREGVEWDAVLAAVLAGTEDGWAALAYAAGVKTPSVETRELVLADLRRAVGNMTLFDSTDDPFPGLS